MEENEIKFILHPSAELEAKLHATHEWHDIEQGYLHEDLRLRRISGNFLGGALRSHYVFSFKRRDRLTGRNIEVESDITEAEFSSLWPFTTNRLIKRRFTVRTMIKPDAVESVRWDIDFPRWPSGTPHFAIGEAEMPPWMEHPGEILPVIAPFVVYEVPRSDNQFAARILSDEDHARRMAVDLKLV